MTMLVSGGDHPHAARPREARRQRLRAARGPRPGARRGGRARAGTPRPGCPPAACRRPSACARRRARRTNVAGPARTEPTGAPSPFEKHIITVSAVRRPVAHRDAGRDAARSTAAPRRGAPRTSCARAASRHRPQRARAARSRRRRGCACSRGRPAARGATCSSCVQARTRRRHLRRRERAALARQRCAPGSPSCAPSAALLVDEDVRLALEQHLVARLGVALDRELVAHRAAGHVERRLLARQRGDAALERLHGGVVAEHVVADLGLGHGLAHGRGGTGDGVAAQVDDRLGSAHGRRYLGSRERVGPGARGSVGEARRRGESGRSCRMLDNPAARMPSDGAYGQAALAGGCRRRGGAASLWTHLSRPGSTHARSESRPCSSGDPTFLLLIPAMILAFWAQWKVQHTYQQMSRVRAANGRTGREMARAILSRNGLSDVGSRAGGGRAHRPLRPAREEGAAVGAATTRATRWRRSPSRPTRSATCSSTRRATRRCRSARPSCRWRTWPAWLAFPLFLIGMIFRSGMSADADGPGHPALRAATLVFHLVTLPVEFNASQRALAQLTEMGTIAPDEVAGREEGAGRRGPHLRGRRGDGGAADPAAPAAPQQPRLARRRTTKAGGSDHSRPPRASSRTRRR